MTAKAPTALKLLRGTQRKDRMNPAEPKPRPLPLTSHPPAWLNLSPTGRKAWHTIAPILRGMNVATTADPLAIGLLCDALSDYIEARDEVRASGPTFLTINDKGEAMIRANPAASIAADAWRRARLLLNDYGLTAAARTKVSAANVSEVDPLAAWEKSR